MVWVGILGGTSYVNVMYLILDTEKLKRTEKEVALSVSNAFNDTGILIASIVSLILYNTVY